MARPTRKASTMCMAHSCEPRNLPPHGPIWAGRPSLSSVPNRSARPGPRSPRARPARWRCRWWRARCPSWWWVGRPDGIEPDAGQGATCHSRSGGTAPCDAGETAEAWEIALVAADLLAADGIRAAVISAPSFELYFVQGDDYRTAVLGAAPRVGVEAATRQDRDALLREGDAFIGMAGFGASAPAAAL